MSKDKDLDDAPVNPSTPHVRGDVDTLTTDEAPRKNRERLHAKQPQLPGQEPDSKLPTFRVSMASGARPKIIQAVSLEDVVRVFNGTEGTSYSLKQLNVEGEDDAGDEVIRKYKTALAVKPLVAQTVMVTGVPVPTPVPGGPQGPVVPLPGGPTPHPQPVHAPQPRR